MADMTEYVKEKLKLLENGHTVKVDYRPIREYMDAFEELGEYDDEWETNGWAVDFWIYFTVQDQKYRLSGSWYYGGYSIDKEV